MGSFPEIYLRPDLHTGHIAEASLDLLHTASQINSNMLDFTKAHFRNIHPDTIRAIIRSRDLKPGTKDRWDQREARMGRLLHTARIIQDPWTVDHKLGRALKRSDFQEPIDIFLFLLKAQHRLDHLLEEDLLPQMSALKFGTYAYVESRLLRGAIYDGVYLTKPS